MLPSEPDGAYQALYFFVCVRKYKMQQFCLSLGGDILGCPETGPQNAFQRGMSLICNRVYLSPFVLSSS